MTNFLSVEKTKKSESTSHRKGLSRRTKKSLRMGAVLVCVFFVAVGVLAGLNYPNAIRAYEQTLAGKESFANAESAMKLQDFSEAETQLQLANTQFKDARDALGKLWMLHSIPFAGRQYAAAKHLLDAGIAVSDGASMLVDIAVVIGDRVGGGENFSAAALTPESKAIILEEIQKAPPTVEAALEKFEEATAQIEKIPNVGVLSQIRDAKNVFSDAIPPITDGLEEFLPLMESLPTIAGHPDAKNYLLLFLNNTELRPGGGFIGTYGELVLRSGTIEKLETDDTYNLDKPAQDYLSIEPPWPMKRFLGSTQWFLRDSNWSPDFATSSIQAVDFYHKEHGDMDPIHGVIGFTPDFTASLLGLTGPITSHGVTFTEENFVDELEYQVEIRFSQQGIPMEERKDIIEDLSKTLVDKIFQLPVSDWPKLFDIFGQDVRQKRIMFYFTDTQLQSFASRMGWAGEFVSPTADYLRLVDANLGSLKSDPGVERTITYTVRYDDELKAPVANADVYYVNTNDFGIFTTRYHTYARLYVPPGIELKEYLWNEDVVEVKSEFDRSVISTFKTTEPREDEHLAFRYRLPDEVWRQIEDGQYVLDVQKQLGTPGYHLIVDIDFGKNIKSFSPNTGVVQDSDSHVRFTTTLDTDQRFVVEF